MGSDLEGRVGPCGGRCGECAEAQCRAHFTEPILGRFEQYDQRRYDDQHQRGGEGQTKTQGDGDGRHVKSERRGFEHERQQTGDRGQRCQQHGTEPGTHGMFECGTDARTRFNFLLEETDEHNGVVDDDAGEREEREQCHGAHVPASHPVTEHRPGEAEGDGHHDCERP